MICTRCSSQKKKRPRKGTRFYEKQKAEVAKRMSADMAVKTAPSNFISTSAERFAPRIIFKIISRRKNFDKKIGNID